MASQELTLGAAAVLLAVFIGGAAIGFAVADLVGAFVGAFGGALVCVTVMGVRRIREADRSLQGPPAMDLRGLDSQQAVTVMGAMLGTEALRSELLPKLEAARRSADPERAIAALLEGQPHSPAVHAELARVRFERGDEAAALDSATEAIRHALDGGMNPLAAKLFVEFEAHRDRLALAPRHYARLARVLRTRDAIEAAQWCEQRSE